jgi:16S rRNA C967 or C1407 C5-methylase (RsmB/RsmF family)
VAKKNARTGFDEYYRELYRERWDALREAMEAEPEPVPFEEPPLTRPYFLDRASIAAARAAGAMPGERVLDLCAAPGGKSLVLVSMLFGSRKDAPGTGGEPDRPARPESEFDAGTVDGKTGAADGRNDWAGESLTVNERSGDRRARLVRVLKEHLPPEIYTHVRVTGHDAARWCLHETDAYDRILLDVPCSSERHLVRSPSHLANWSTARTKHLALQSFAMLSSAFRVVKPGGVILYSTCTLSALENDRVVEKLLARQAGRAAVEPAPAAYGVPEPTEYGTIVLPDRSGGLGPMYWARIRRLS